MPPRLPRYEILAELGQGGMSVVYRARDTQLPREVAVKVLHEFMARDPDARLRFHREAVAVAKLHHPGIVEIFDYSGADAPEAFIVTELIEGVTLRELIEQHGRLGLPELGALVTAGLCEALAHAHDAGVVHRDLKPENVMVTRQGELKLMDFGIAQIADGPRVTVTGTLLGSPAHMAPEVIDGARPDARADLFSLGTILYWLTTGALPFEAPNPSALFRRILEGEYPDPQQIEPRMGNGLARVIRRALERDPAARYADARALQAALVQELELVGLVPIATEVRALLAAPEAYAERMRAPVVDRLCAAGKAALADGNVARAMDRLSRVLAIEPSHAEARHLVASLGRREARARWVRRTAAAAATVLLAGSAAWAGNAWRVDAARGVGPRAPGGPGDGGLATGAREGRGGDERPEAAGSAATSATSAMAASAASATGPGTARAEGVPPSAELSPGRVGAEGGPLGDRGAAGAAGAARIDARVPPVLTEDGDPGGAGRRSGTARARGPTDAAATFTAALGAADASGSGARTAAPREGAADARAIAAVSPDAEPTRAVVGELRLRIGNSFANVYVDGELARADFFGGTLRLPPGEHVLEVRKPGFGGFRPRRVEVDAEGRVSELRGSDRQRIAGELLFAVPRQGQEPPSDWVPESGTASSRPP